MIYKVGKAWQLFPGSNPGLAFTRKGIKEKGASCMAKYIFKASAYIITVLFILWFLYSFYDVINHNLTTGVYWRYNAFIIISKVRKGF